MAAKRKYNRTGRSKGGPLFLKLDRWIFDSPAFRSLRPTARALLFELIRRFNGTNNGFIVLGEREAAEALGLKDREAVRSYFNELESKGFIVCMVRGAFSRKTGPQRASEWRLTWEPHAAGTPATKDFMRWQAEGAEQNQRDGFSANAGQESCPVPMLSPALWANRGRESRPANSKCDGASGREACPHIDMPSGGGSKRTAGRGRRHVNGTATGGVGHD